MKEKFYTSRLISKEEMKQLNHRSNHPALLRFVVMYALFIILNILVVLAWSSSIFYILLSQIAYGILCCSIFAAEHETIHGTAFQSKRWNQIGAALAGFAHIYPSSLFRELHFTHHRFTHIPGKDPEISLGHRGAPSILDNLGMYMSWLSGLPLLMFKVMMLLSGVLGMPDFLRSNLYPFVNPKRRRKIFLESLIFLIGYGTIIYFAVTVEPRLVSILIGQIVGHCFLSVYLAMEHNGLPHEGNILNKTRSIQTSKFIKLVMWNMPYHAEHHAYPSVPFHALPQLHQVLEGELVHQENHLQFNKVQFSKFFNKM